MRTSALIVVLFFLGCSGGGKKDTTGPNGGGGGGGGEGGGGSGPVTLVSVGAEGGSCVAVVKNAAGEEQSHPAASDLCPGGAKDAINLAGKPVNLEMGKAAGGDAPSLPAGEDPCRDIAPPCGGDTSGTVDMVVGISPAS